MFGIIYGVILIAMSIFVLTFLSNNDVDKLSPLIMAFSLFASGIIVMTRTNDPTFYVAIMSTLVVQPIIVVIIVMLLDNIEYLKTALPYAILGVLFIPLLFEGSVAFSVGVVTFLFIMLAVKLIKSNITYGLAFLTVYFIAFSLFLITLNNYILISMELILFIESIMVIYVLYIEGKTFEKQFKPFEPKRKAFHLLALLAAIPLFSQDFIIKLIRMCIEQLDPQFTSLVTTNNLVNFAVIIVLGSVIPLFLAVEYMRIAKGALIIPTSLLRKNEEKSMASYVYTVVSVFIIALIFPQMILITAVLVGLLADAMAAIVGIYFGKHKITKNRTLEGTLAGFTTAFLITYLIMGNLLGAILVAIATSTFDALNTREINDNFIFPMLTAIVLYFV